MFDSLPGDFCGTHGMVFIPNEILFAEVFQQPKKDLIERLLVQVWVASKLYAYLVLLT